MEIESILPPGHQTGYLSGHSFSPDPGNRFVAGFMFSQDLLRVALIRKNKPRWQEGKLNGIGGKVEADESMVQAMVREFSEEAGLETNPEDWSHFHSMHGINDDGAKFELGFFASRGELICLSSKESEVIRIHQTDEITPLRQDIIPNLCWLIALAVDHLTDGRPSFVSAFYGDNFDDRGEK